MKFKIITLGSNRIPPLRHADLAGVSFPPRFKTIGDLNRFSSASAAALLLALQRLGIRIDRHTGRISYLKNRVIKPLPFELIWVRHGQTPANVNKIFQGRSDETNIHGTGLNDLNHNGLRQASEAAHLLKDDSFDEVMIGLRKRVHDTYRAYRLVSGNEKPPFILNGLDEIDFGHSENHRIQELQGDDLAMAQAYRNFDAFARHTDGESFVIMILRANLLLHYLSSNFPRKRLLACSHGTLGNAVRVVRGMIEPESNGDILWRGSGHEFPNAQPIQIK